MSATNGINNHFLFVLSSCFILSIIVVCFNFCGLSFIEVYMYMHKCVCIFNVSLIIHSFSSGKLVSIKGTVIRVGSIKLFCTRLAFSCNKCNKIQCVLQQDGCYTLPTSCTTQSCMSRTFVPLCSSSYTQTINWQIIKIQEIITDDQVNFFYFLFCIIKF